MLATISIVLKGVSNGLGHHEVQVAPEKLAQAAKWIYAWWITTDLAITLPKYSAIFFYVRVFRLKSTFFRVNVFTSLALVTAWILYAPLSGIFRCLPIQKAWAPLTPGHCLDLYPVALGTVTTSVAIDLYITLLPIPVIWKLHTGRARKIILIGFCFCAYW